MPDTSVEERCETNRPLSHVTDIADLVIPVVHRLTPVTEGATSITYLVEVSGPAVDVAENEVGTGSQPTSRRSWRPSLRPP